MTNPREIETLKLTILTLKQEKILLQQKINSMQDTLDSKDSEIEQLQNDVMGVNMLKKTNERLVSEFNQLNEQMQNLQ